MDDSRGVPRKLLPKTKNRHLSHFWAIIFLKSARNSWNCFWSGYKNRRILRIHRWIRIYKDPQIIMDPGLTRTKQKHGSYKSIYDKISYILLFSPFLSTIFSKNCKNARFSLKENGYSKIFWPKLLFITKRRCGSVLTRVTWIQKNLTDPYPAGFFRNPDQGCNRGGGWLFGKNPNFWAEKLEKSQILVPQAPKFLKIFRFFVKSHDF